MKELELLEDIISTDQIKTSTEEKKSIQQVVEMIISMSQVTGGLLIESAVEVADILGIDQEAMKSYITRSLKEMIQLECEQAGMLKKDTDPSFVFE